MSVRQSLLAILAQGPCYGYQLRHEFDRRTGSVWPLNVGQIYNTLERLERDGLVRRGDADEHGHVYWQITEAGEVEVGRWLTSPVVRAQGTRDELAIKLAVTATLPGVDASAAIQAQRAASMQQLDGLRDARQERGEAEGPEGLAWSLVVDSMIFTAEAEVRWLDHVEQRLARHPQHAMALELTAERPKRGRPAKTGGVIEQAVPAA
ncbi:PadR family transcriptional regulator [Microbacterium sp. NPDC090218]